jgi:hypothetical protein
LMEADGPGCITRVWVADPQKGTVKIEIDGATAITCGFAELFQRLPLSFGIGGESAENYARSKEEGLPMGHTCYCPIAFQHHCKVSVEPEDDYLYYQVNYHLLPPGTHVDNFSQSSPRASDVDAAEAIVADWSEGGPLVEMPAPSSEITLQPGEGHVIFDASGPGAIRGIRVNSPSFESADATGRHLRENVWLVAHFDDDEPRDPSVLAPIGPMFLDYGQSPTPRSLYVGLDTAGYYCFFPMPYRERAEVKVVNRSILPITLCVSVESQAFDVFDGELLRFRATWHIETPFGPDHRDYNGVACRLLNLDGFNNVELLNVDGAGHFVGCGFQVDLRDSPTDRAAGEGDEMFFIDDDPRLTMNGTGLEDYVNDAWGMRGYVGPLSGDAGGAWGVDPQIYGYRLHVPDPVPFTRKGRFTLEHGTGNNTSGLYKSVAYWYMDPARSRTRIEEWRWEAIRTGERKMNQDDE